MSLIQKLKNERKEISKRIAKLKTFLDSTNFKTLDLNQQNLLIEQLRVMNKYEYILLVRIKDIERRNINGPTK